MRSYNTLLALLPGLSMASPVDAGGQMISPRADSFTNPILWQDHPDLDVFRVGDVFYYSSSTFAFSPGAPILKSYDLVNWTPVSHSVPTLNFGDKYNLPNANTRAYVKGIWASTMRYRNSTDTFYWLGCIEGKTYIWTAAGTNAASNDGEVNSWSWKPQTTLPQCYYDAGLLIDDNDTMYVAYGNPSINVAQLNSDATAQVKSQQVYKAPDATTLEGSRMYKRGAYYYIFVTRPATAEFVLRSSSPWGPYERRTLVDGIQGPLSQAGTAHQGGMVDAKDGNWYYIAFLDAYPAGRIPVAAPLTWHQDWPQVVKVDNQWGKTYPLPVRTGKTVPLPTRLDGFVGTSLHPEWEWNHNPDAARFALIPGGGGLSLKTASVTNDLYSARNTLTHRILGPKSTATFRLDVSGLADGDRAGAVLFRDSSAYVGVHRSSARTQVVFVNNLELNSNWSTKSPGVVAATGPELSGGSSEIWLRIKADVTPAFGSNNLRQATFWYSLDGSSWKQLGGGFGMTNSWQFFTGYRFGVFNFATKALGGELVVKSFAFSAISFVIAI